MPSPLPGMNPWIERAAVWQDFHDSILPTMREALNQQIAPRYLARVQEHVYVDEVDGEPLRVGKPDVSVSEWEGAPPDAGGVGTLIAPVRVRQVEPEIERELFLEIRDREERRLIAAIELLSPANKRTGPIRKQYLQKREALLESDAHFLEIDLLRGGPRMPWRGLPTCDYYALVSRVELRPEAEFWPIRLRDPLPTIPVPLKPGDPDARLDLQALLHRVYDAGAYAADIYAGTPEPPLGAEGDAWARSVLG